MFALRFPRTTVLRSGDLDEVARPMRCYLDNLILGNDSNTSTAIGAHHARCLTGPRSDLILSFPWQLTVLL